MAAKTPRPHHRGGQADPLPRRRAEGAADHRGRRPAGRPSPRRRLDPRGLPRRRPRTRSLRPQRLRRRSCGSARPGSRRRKTLEDFDFDAQPAVRQQVAALASGAFLTEARNVVLLGPPGTGKTHLATALGVAAARHGHRVLFATATDWVTRLTDAHRARPAARRARPAAPLRADHRRRGRLPALRARRREPVLPTRLLPLRTRLADPDLEPAVLRLGRRVRRPSRRRRHDRPHRPPRRRPHPQRRQLPAPRPRHRQPAQHPKPSKNP